MLSIEKCAVPVDTLLHEYFTKGAYADCYRNEIPQPVSFPEFIFAFYTTPLFKLERFILARTVSKPSTDTQARQLANCEIDTFAAWQVENQRENEILMCDYRGRTRSWLSVVSAGDGGTRLYFGSAVVPRRNSKNGRSSLGFVFQMLLGFHRIYSVLLLYSAKRKLVHSAFGNS
jgi:hypothetical protein